MSAPQSMAVRTSSASLRRFPGSSIPFGWQAPPGRSFEPPPGRPWTFPKAHLDLGESRSDPIGGRARFSPQGRKQLRASALRRAWSHRKDDLSRPARSLPQLIIGTHARIHAPSYGWVCGKPGKMNVEKFSLDIFSQLT